MGRHSLSFKKERGLARQERLRLRHSSEEAEGSADERGDGAGQWPAIEDPIAYRACLRSPEGQDGPVRQTIGIARATMKIGMANLAYNITRYVWHEKKAAAA